MVGISIASLDRGLFFRIMGHEIMDGFKFYIRGTVGDNVESIRRAGVSDPQSLHSSVNLSHKSLSKMLQPFQGRSLLSLVIRY